MVKMQKWLALALTLTMLLTLCACDKKTDDKPKDTPSTADKEPSSAPSVTAKELPLRYSYITTKNGEVEDDEVSFTFQWEENGYSSNMVWDYEVFNYQVSLDDQQRPATITSYDSDSEETNLRFSYPDEYTVRLDWESSSDYSIWQYNQDGLLIREEHDYVTKHYEYDDYGNCTRERSEYTDGDCEEKTTVYTYDADGKISMAVSTEENYLYEEDRIEQTHYSYYPNGNVMHTFAIDSYGNLNVLFHPYNPKDLFFGYMQISHHSYPLTTSIETDAAGRIVKIEREDGAIATFSYDEHGNVTTYSSFDKRITHYEYDAQNRPLTTNIEESNGDTATTTYTYDAQGRLVKTEGIASNGESALTLFEYNESGMLTKTTTTQTSANGDVRTSITEAEYVDSSLCPTDEKWVSFILRLILS